MSRHKDAVALAGALAEHGVGVVELHSGRPGCDAFVVLRARQCDLPGEIGAAGEGAILRVAPLGLEIRVCGDGLVVVAATSDDARAIARAVQNREP